MSLQRGLRRWAENAPTEAAVAAALAFTAVAVVLRWMVDGWLGSHLPLVTLYLSVSAATWLGGRWSGALATLIGFVACNYLFIDPRGSLAIDPGALVGGVAYVVVSVVLIASVDAPRRALARARTETSHAEVTRALLASIVAASDDAIVSKSLDGIVMSWNAGAERLFGYTADEVIGRHISLIIPVELRQEEQTILQRLREGHRIDHFETVRVAKDGHRLDISLTVSPLRDETGRIVGASKVARDITLRKQTEAALRLANRRKDEFLATLAHELRNPLAPIQHSLEIVRRTPGNAQLMQRSVDTIGRQLSHLIRLVDDLLDVSRISRDKLHLRKARVELGPIVWQAVETCRPRAEQERQMVDVSLPPVPIYLEADAVRLTQVLSNLLNNASQYTGPGGRIWCTVERDGLDVVIVVKDTGIGVAAHHLDDIFEMFVQVDDDVDRPRCGLGIGLTLVKRLVELHGGSIAARSAGLGRGCEFEVRLPAAGDPAALDHQLPRESVDCVPLQILVVDDNEDGAESIATLLELSGHRTFIARDGIAAVEAADRWRPDVVLMDIGLPRMSGVQACQRIRSHSWGNEMIIVALTGWGQENDRRATSDAGFDGHLVKPVEYTHLQHLLADLGHRTPRAAAHRLSPS